MHKHGAAALFVAFVIAFSLASPLTVRSSSGAVAAVHGQDGILVVTDDNAAHDDSPTVAIPDTSPADSSVPATVAGDESAPRSKGGNGFVRAITAPFRAIGRLFGGGKKNRTERSTTEATAEAAVKIAGGAVTNDGAPRVIAAAAVAGDKRDKATKRDKAPKKSERAERAHAGSLPPVQETVQTVAAAAALTTALSTGVRETPREMSQPFTPVIEDVPRDALSQGRALLESGHLNEAIAQLSIAATVGPDLLEANNLLGQAYDRRGWHTLAQVCYERALEAAPKDPRTHVNLGHSLYLSDNYRPALKRLKQAARLAPFDARITHHIAQVQFRLGDYEGAFKNLAHISNDFEARVILARMFEGTARPAEAIRQYERALKLQPNAPAVLETLAMLYQQTGRTREAEATRRTLRQPPNKQKTTTGG